MSLSKKERAKIIADHERQALKKSLENQSIEDVIRARSVTVGTICGGSTEVGLRRANGDYTYVILQPVETAELINQLAANIGCHVALQARNDFASWRDWRVPEAEKKHLNGHPPFVSNQDPFRGIGRSEFDQKSAEESIENWLVQDEYRYVDGAATQTVFRGETENAVATEEAVNEPSIKRSKTAS